MSFILHKEQKCNKMKFQIFNHISTKNQEVMFKKRNLQIQYRRHENCKKKKSIVAKMSIFKMNKATKAVHHV